MVGAIRHTHSWIHVLCSRRHVSGSFQKGPAIKSDAFFHPYICCFPLVKPPHNGDMAGLPHHQDQHREVGQLPKSCFRQWSRWVSLFFGEPLLCLRETKRKPKSLRPSLFSDSPTQKMLKDPNATSRFDADRRCPGRIQEVKQ